MPRRDHGLPDEERAVVEAVARWVDREVRPVAGPLERAGEYPGALIDQMKEMGVFGLAVPARWSESAAEASRAHARRDILLKMAEAMNATVGGVKSWRNDVEIGRVG